MLSTLPSVKNIEIIPVMPFSACPYVSLPAILSTTLAFLVTGAVTARFAPSMFITNLPGFIAKGEYKDELPCLAKPLNPATALPIALFILTNHGFFRQTFPFLPQEER